MIKSRTLQTTLIVCAAIVLVLFIIAGLVSVLPRQPLDKTDMLSFLAETELQNIRNFIPEKGALGLKCADGGYAVLANRKNDSVLLKLSPDGDAQWTVQAGPGFGRDITETKYVYAACGNVKNGPRGGVDVFISGVYKNGSPAFTRFLGGAEDDNAASLKACPDSSFVFCGKSHSGKLRTFMYLAKLNRYGSTEWERKYSLRRFTSGRFALGLSNGNILAAGETSRLGGLSPQVYAVMTDAKGDCVWARTYDVENWNSKTEIKETLPGKITLQCESDIAFAKGSELTTIYLNADGTEKNRVVTQLTTRDAGW